MSFSKPNLNRISRQKAGIYSNEPIKLYKFEVKRYK